MPVRKMTQQEVREWLGKGIVLSGIKPPKRLPQPSKDKEKSAEAAQCDVDQPFRGDKSDR
jgi:hypothetical protein